MIATATAAITTTTTTTTTTGGSATGLSLVDPQGTAHQLGALQGLDGSILQAGIGHLHEGKATLAARIPLQGQGAVRHLSVGRKQLCNVFLFCAEGQIADKNAHEPGRPRGLAMRASGPLTDPA